MQRLYRFFRFRQYNDFAPKLTWPFLFRDEEINHLNQIFATCQQGQVQTVIIRRKQVPEELDDERLSTETKNQSNSIDGRGIGKTRLLTEWKQKLSSGQKNVGIVDLINLRPKLQSGTYKISNLIIAQTQRFSTIWNRKEITLLIKWILSRLITVILIAWIGIVAAITFLASVFTIISVLGIPGEIIASFIMQNRLLIAIAVFLALVLSFVAYQSGPIQKARKQWEKFLHPLKWRQVIADKGSPSQIADMLLRCLRRDLTYVFLIDDFDCLDAADYDLILNISEMMKKNKFKAMFVISYNRDNPSLTESIGGYFVSDLERNAPNKHFIDLPVLTEEQITTIVARGFHDYNPMLVDEAVRISHWFFGYTNPSSNALVTMNGRCDLIFGFFEYLVDQGLIRANKASSASTPEVNDENLVRLFEQFLSRSLEQYRKLLEYLQQFPKGADCLMLLRWLLSFQRAKIRIDELHAVSRIPRSTLIYCLKVLRKKGVIKEYRSGYCEIDPEWRILLVHHWLDWNTDNIYTHQVFEYILSSKNLVEQENIEEQALLANPCAEAIEILIKKATYLSDDLGYMQKSLRYFDGAFKHWKKLLLHSDKNAANQQRIVNWQAMTNYCPSINALSKDELEQDVKPIVLCHTIALICIRLGDYKRAHEIMTEWLEIEHLLSDLSLTSTWKEIEHIAQKLQILNVELLLREGDWSTAQKVISSLKESSIPDIAHTATSLDLRLKCVMSLGLEHLARRYYVPQMRDTLHRLASAYLSDQTDPILYVRGLQIEIRFEFNDELMAFMKQEKEADAFSFQQTCKTLTMGVDGLLLAFKASKSRYSDLEFLGVAIRMFETFIVLVNTCNLSLQAWLANPNNERISKIKDIYKVLLQLTRDEMPRIREVLGSDFYQINQETHNLISQFIMIDLNDTQMNELATNTQKVASELERVFHQSVSTMFDRAIRLAEYLGCRDNLPDLLTARCMRRVQDIANLPEDSPEKENAVVEIATELGRALSIADRIGRVDGTEKTCAALGMIYDEFLLHYSKAAQYYRRAASICQNLGMPNIQVAYLFMHAATIYHNIAVIYPDESDDVSGFERECLVQAREHFLLAVEEKEYSEQYGEQLKSNIVKLDFELAAHSLQSQDLTQALFFTNDIINRIILPISDEEKIQKAKALFLKGRILVDNNQFEIALNSFEEALDLFIKSHDDFHELQVLRTIVDFTSPRRRLYTPSFEDFKKIMRTPGSAVQWIDWVSLCIEKSQGMGIGMLRMTFVLPHPLLDKMWSLYFPLLCEKYEFELAKGIENLSSEFRLEMAQASLEIAVSSGELPDIKHLRDAFYLYLSVGEAKKAFEILRVFLASLATIPQAVLPHRSKPYSKDDFQGDAHALLRSLKEESKEAVDVAANLFMLLESVNTGQIKIDSDRRQAFIQARGLKEAGRIDDAISILRSLVANVFQETEESTPDAPKIPTELDLSITSVLYDLEVNNNNMAQAAEVDAKRHYLEAIRASFNLLKLGQEYEQINPQIALQLYKMAFNTKIETIYAQLSRQRYYRLEEQLAKEKPETVVPINYTFEANPEYFAMVGDKFFGSEQYEEAIKHYKKGLDICIKTKNKRLQIYFLIQLGVCFINLEQFPEAIESFNDCIEACKGSDYFTYLAIAESNLGSIYSIQNQKTKAKLHYQKALEAFQKMRDEKGIAFAEDRIRELSKSD